MTISDTTELASERKSLIERRIMELDDPLAQRFGFAAAYILSQLDPSQPLPKSGCVIFAPDLDWVPCAAFQSQSRLNRQPLITEIHEVL